MGYPEQNSDFEAAVLRFKEKGIRQEYLCWLGGGGQPHVLRTMGLVLSIPAAEYVEPVCGISAHTKQVDIAVNETVRIATGCLEPYCQTVYHHKDSTTHHPEEGGS